MKIQHLIPILFLAGFCTVRAQTNIPMSDAMISTQKVLYCSGTVRYPDGAPAANVRVGYYPGHHPGSGYYAEAQTDANGRYVIIGPKDMRMFMGIFNRTNSILARYLAKNLAAIQDVDFTMTNVDLVLQPAITLSGSVMNTDGAPIVEAEVELRFVLGETHLLEGRSVKVNESGQFSMSALPRGCWYEAYVVIAKDYGLDDADVYPKDTLTNRYTFPTFVLKHTDKKLAGRVLDENGNPLVGVEVSFSGKGQPMNSKEKWGQQPFCNTTTDSKGDFSFDAVCDGPVRIYVTPHDNRHYNGWGMQYQDTHGGDTNIVIRLDPK